MPSREHEIILSLVLQTKNLEKEVKRITTGLQKATPKADIQVSPASYRNLDRLNKGLKTTSVESKKAEKGMTSLASATAIAAKRLLAYSLAAAPLYAVGRAINDAAKSAIDFEYQLTRIAQVQRRTLSGMAGLEQEISRLSTGIGAVSSDLVQVSRLLAQSGLNARDTQIALESLAKTSLTPSFNDIIRTTEGAIAIINQFGTSASMLETQLGSINAVAKRFAVESEDIITVIRKAGGVFQSTGGQLDELVALFTAVRSTTRESADTIGTGFRTIFARLQRTRTINLLRKLGIETEGLTPYERIREIAKAVDELRKQGGTTSPAISKITEELGGLRQIAKVIPLLGQFEKAEKALAIAKEGRLSLDKDVAIAQDATAIQIRKVKEEFLELGRAFLSDKSIQLLIKSTLELTTNLVKMVDALRPALPLLLAFGGLKLASLAGGVFRGAKDPISIGGLNRGIGGTGFKSGGVVPAMVTPGEVIFTPDQVQKIGLGTLQKMNKFARGGAAGVVPGSGNSDSVYADLESGSFVLRKRAAEQLGFNSGGRVRLATGDFLDDDYEAEYRVYKEDINQEAREQAKIQKEITITQNRRKAELARQQRQQEAQFAARVRKGTASDRYEFENFDPRHHTVSPRPIRLPDQTGIRPRATTGDIPQTRIVVEDTPTKPAKSQPISLPDQGRVFDPTIGAFRPKSTKKAGEAGSAYLSPKTIQQKLAIPKREQAYAAELSDNTIKLIRGKKAVAESTKKAGLLARARAALTKSYGRAKHAADASLGSGAVSTRQPFGTRFSAGVAGASRNFVSSGGLTAAAFVGSSLANQIPGQDPRSAALRSGVGSGLSTVAVVGAFNPLVGAIAGAVVGLKSFSDSLKEAEINAENRDVSQSSQRIISLLERGKTDDDVALRIEIQKFKKSLDPIAKNVGGSLGPSKAGLEQLKRFKDVSLESSTTIANAIASGRIESDDNLLRNIGISQIGDEGLPSLQRTASQVAGAELEAKVKRGDFENIESEFKRAGAQMQFLRERTKEVTFNLLVDSGKKLVEENKKIIRDEQLRSQAINEARNVVKYFSEELTVTAESMRIASESVSGFDQTLNRIAGDSSFRASTTNLTTLENFRAASPASYRQAVESVAGKDVADTVSIQQQIQKVLPSLIEETKSSGQVAVDDIMAELSSRFGDLPGGEAALSSVLVGLSGSIDQLIGNVQSGGARSISDSSLEPLSFAQGGFKAIAKERIKIEQDFINNLLSLNKIHRKAIAARIDVVSAQQDILSTQQQFSANRGLSLLSAISSTQSSDLFAQSQALTLGRDSARNRLIGTSPALLGQEINKERANLRGLELERSSTIDPDRLFELDAQIAKANDSINGFKEALSNLRQSTLELSTAQSRLAALQQAQQQNFSLLDRLATSRGGERRGLIRDISSAETLLAQGNVSGGRFASGYTTAQQIAQGTPELALLQSSIRSQASQLLPGVTRQRFADIDQRVDLETGNIKNIQKTRLRAAQVLGGQAQTDEGVFREQLEGRQKELNEKFQETINDARNFIQNLDNSSKTFERAANAIPKTIDLDGNIVVTLAGGKSFEESLANAVANKISSVTSTATSDPTRPPSQNTV